MTTLEIVQRRATDLRDFFIGRFGYGWQTQVRKRIGMRRQLPMCLLGPQTIKRFPSPCIERFEALAVKLGYKLGNLERPFETHERKSVPRKRRATCCLNVSDGGRLNENRVPLSTDSDFSLPIA
jgi:hypothetical protein